MNLTIDFEELIPIAIDVYTKVLGEEYHNIICEKGNNTLYLQYINLKGLDCYLENIKLFKKRQYSIEFLKRIGIDVEKYKNDSYVSSLDEKVEKFLRSLFDFPYMEFNLAFMKKYSPLYAFHSDNDFSADILIKNKLKLINYMRDNPSNQITEETFEQFSKTKEYSDLLIQINKMLDIYDDLLNEYTTWQEKILPYEKYIEGEKKRKSKILSWKKLDVFTKVFNKLPESIKNAIKNKSLEEQQNLILGYLDISFDSHINLFVDGMRDLKSSDINFNMKTFIVSCQVNYLKNMGVKISDEFVSNLKTEDDIRDYLKFLEQDDVKKFIPSNELINYISSLKKEKYEEAIKNYYMTRDDVVSILRFFNNDKNRFKTIYDIIRDKRVCVTSGNNDKIGFISIMFYAVRQNTGELFYTFLHEFGHIIEQNPWGTGFELDNNEVNRYDKAFRKYERFNETINDLLATEAYYSLCNKGEFYIEPKEFTQFDIENNNTARITRNLLKPLLQKFRKQVIYAKVNANRAALIKYIGESNFEELVDVVNKVDYLSRNGVITKLKKGLNDSMVQEYYEQVDRVQKIYDNIDNYYNVNLCTTITDVSSLGVRNK